MNKNECFELGYILRPHGLSGELNVVFDVDDVSHYENIKLFYVEKKKQYLEPYKIEYLDFQPNRIIAKLDEVDDIDSAQALKGCGLYLPLNMLPPLEEGQFYYHQIIGYQVHDAHLGYIGNVIVVYTTPGQDLIAVNHNNTEILVPITDHIVLRVDNTERKVYTQLPDGLLDVYLQP
jgi:16S rRNA processing protein RimM